MSSFTTFKPMSSLFRMPTRRSDWWKWGEAGRRKSMDDYPKLAPFLSGRYAGQSWNVSAPVASVPLRRDPAAHNELFVRFSAELPHVQVSNDPDLRLEKSLGKSYHDLIRVLSQEPLDLPDWIVFPKNHEETEAVLNWASRYRVSVVPFGGGSNVVGAFDRTAWDAPKLMLDMHQMNRMLELDEVNLTARFEAGIFGPALEKELNARGFTLSHFPQSFEYSTLGGWIATRSAGQESTGYGRIEDLTVSIRAASPAGSIETSCFEGDAEGVNLRWLFYGSEGTLGVITEARLRIHRLTKSKKWMTALFPDFEQGSAALREMVQAGIWPSVVRFSDEEETRLLSLLSHSNPSLTASLQSALLKKYLSWKNMKSPCLMMLRFDGSEAQASLLKKESKTLAVRHGGIYVGESAGIKWESSRFGLPYLRDDMLERGLLVDTMETIMPWNKIGVLKDTLKKNLEKSAAFGNEKGLLMTHLSHLYMSGSSMYFTVITPMNKQAPLQQWREIKQIVSDTIHEAGGPVSHHHSVGLDHRPWYLKRTDALSLDLLRSLKHKLDPEGILNPGKLFDVKS